MPGPLSGVRVAEFAGIGPIPFCGMLFADMGADVVRIDRPSSHSGLGALADVCGRGKRSVAIDLKTADGLEAAMRLLRTADVMIEGFRPGVAERLGIGPVEVAATNPRLIYGRMTGWGQSGPLAALAGHDINYIGLAGALHAIGDSDPVVPLNLVGDYGGGAMFLATGVLAALVERSESDVGQVIDVAMVDGVATLMTPIYQLLAAGQWQDGRNANLLDGAAPFYRSYETAEGGYMAVGALEPAFYARFLELLELDEDPASQMDVRTWPDLHERIAAIFIAEPRIHWESLFTGEDACVTPVLSLEEAPQHAQNQARMTFVTRNSSWEPAPAPRFSRTESEAGSAAPAVGADTAAVLGELGYTVAEVDSLAGAGVVEGASL